MAKFKFTDITKLAKKIRAKKPKMKWTSAIKEASRQLKSGRKISATLLIEKKETKKTKPKRVVRITRLKSGRFKKLQQVSGKGKYKMSGTHTSISNVPGYSDPDAAREIELYADNNNQLYFSRRLPILKNLAKKYRKGIYDTEKAAILWRYYIEDAMQRYHREFGSRGDHWTDRLKVPDRQLLAMEYAKQLKDEFDHGIFSHE